MPPLQEEHDRQRQEQDGLDVELADGMVVVDDGHDHVRQHGGVRADAQPAADPHDDCQRQEHGQGGDPRVDHEICLEVRGEHPRQEDEQPRQRGIEVVEVLVGQLSRVEAHRVAVEDQDVVARGPCGEEQVEAEQHYACRYQQEPVPGTPARIRPALHIRSSISPKDAPEAASGGCRPSL